LEVTGRRPDCSRRTSDVATLIVLNFAHANATSGARGKRGGGEGRGGAWVAAAAAVAEEVDRLLTTRRGSTSIVAADGTMSIRGNNGTGKLVQRTDGFSCLVRKILSRRWYRVALGSP